MDCAANALIPVMLKNAINADSSVICTVTVAVRRRGAVQQQVLCLKLWEYKFTKKNTENTKLRLFRHVVQRHDVLPAVDSCVTVDQHVILVPY